MNKKLSLLLVNFLVLIISFVFGFGGWTYLKLPTTDILTVTEEVYYSNGDGIASADNSIQISSADISVHFLELGNKYTGDCTYIKTKDADILIDCGSKSNSIPTVSSYLNQYVTDNTLEYVVVTHAHQDHYAGFATTKKVDSIFDLYTCENIIDFGKACNQKATASVYNNYLRERNDEIANGASYYTAIDCAKNQNGARKEFIIDDEKNIKFEVLYNYYNEYNRDDETTSSYKAHSENDYSVCLLFTYGEQHFLFTGDLEEEGENHLISNNTLPKIDLYKAGHHGSKTSSTKDFIDLIQPKTVCVCCCAGSSEYTSNPLNQFPTQDFINNVSKYAEKIYVTSLCVDYDNDEFTSFNGNIVYMATATSYNVECSNNKTDLRESDWFKANRTLPSYP